MDKNVFTNTIFLNHDKKRLFEFLEIYLSNRDMYSSICENERQTFDVEKYQEGFTKNIFAKYVDIKIKQMEAAGDYSLSNVRKYDLLDLMNGKNKSDEEKRLSEELEFLYCDSAGTSSLGFHINDRFLTNGDMSWFRNEVKIYINSDSDIYKIARLFWDKCDQRNIKVYFKLTATPYENYGLNRTDKLCIYSSYDDLDTYISLLDEIRNENPDLTFLSPPISTAIYNGYIGIGCDLSKSQLVDIKHICVSFSNSYNSIISSVFKESVEKFLKDNNLDKNNKNEVIRFVNTEAGYLKLVQVLNNYLSEIAEITNNKFFKYFSGQIPSNIKYIDKDQKDKNKNI